MGDSEPATEPAQAKACAALIFALARELDYIAEKTNDPPEKEWQVALNRWGNLIASENFEKALTSKIRLAESLELPEDSAKELLTNLPSFVLAVTRPFIDVYTRSGRMTDATRLLGVCAKSGFESRFLEEFLVSTVRDISNVPLEKLISQARAPFEEGRKVNYQVFAQRFDAILADAEAITRELIDRLQLDEKFISDLRFDDLVEAIIDRAANSLNFKQTKDNVELKNRLQAILTLDRAMELPMNESLRYRLKAAINNYRSQLYPADSGNTIMNPIHCFFLPGEKASPEHSLIMPVCKIDTIRFDGYTWSKRFVLVPRSALARDLQVKKLSPKNLMERHGNSPRIRILHDPKELARIKNKAFKTVHEVVVSALKKLIYDFLSLSKKLGKICVNSDEAFELEKEVQKVKTLQTEHASWAKRQFSKKGCGFGSIWRYYLPCVLVGGVMPLVLPTETLANIAPFHALSELAPLKTLSKSISGTLDGLFPITPQMVGLMGAGFILAAMTHVFLYLGWRSSSRRRSTKLNNKLNDLHNRLNTLRPGFNEIIDDFRVTVSRTKMEFEHASMDSKAIVSKAESTALSFSDLKSENMKTDFPFYINLIEQGYENGIEPNKSTAKNKQIAMIRDTSENELDRILIKAGVSASQLFAIPSYKKRELLIDAIAKS